MSKAEKYEYTPNYGFLTPEEKQALKPIVMGSSEKISNDLIMDKLQKQDKDMKEIKLYVKHIASMLNDMSSELNLPLEMDLDYCKYCKASPCKNKMHTKCDSCSEVQELVIHRDNWHNTSDRDSQYDYKFHFYTYTKRLDGDINNLCMPCLRERQTEYDARYVESVDANFET